MLYFLAGLFVGSPCVLFTMSLMVAAKNGDQRLEAYQNEKSY
ncbi:DUF3789 domain-containing protein [Neobacillus muris]|nr:hypothetical protein [Neobacillus muris]